MTGSRNCLSDLVERESALRVEFGEHQICSERSWDNFIPTRVRNQDIGSTRKPRYVLGDIGSMREPRCVLEMFEAAS
jgi:hypothetical protein